MKYLVILFLIFAPNFAFADSSLDVAPNNDEYVRAKVIEVLEEKDLGKDSLPQPYQRLRVQILDGEYVNQIIEIEQGADYHIGENDIVDVGNKVVLIGLEQDNQRQFYIIDQYRLPQVAIIAMIFFAVVVWVAGRKGFGSIIGLGISLFIIGGYIVPSIISGGNPLIVSLIGATLITLISITVAHGFEKRTGIALISTFITLVLAVGIAWLYVVLAKLTGLGSENAFYLQVGDLANLDLRGLLLGGIIIGALGVLDDVTTSQTAAVEEIYKADQTVSSLELYKRSMSVGKEHIASLVNTLALAYVGAAFPLFLLIAVNETQPTWVIFNGQLIMEEIVRTLVGSMALVLAVPITTIIAIWAFKRAFFEEK